MEIKMKLLPPCMPNFIMVEQKPELRQEGYKNKIIDVADFTDEEAEQYGELMKQTFINHAKERRRNK